MVAAGDGGSSRTGIWLCQEALRQERTRESGICFVPFLDPSLFHLFCGQMGNVFLPISFPLFSVSRSTEG